MSLETKRHMIPFPAEVLPRWREDMEKAVKYPVLRDLFCLGSTPACAGTISWRVAGNLWIARFYALRRFHNILKSYVYTCFFILPYLQIPVRFNTISTRRSGRNESSS